ncbi:MAG TPA: hypothetical protein VKE22_25430 [Haliangiales bacterium]|nr:hypothetical protein [Haliangiales bacterium]
MALDRSFSFSSILNSYFMVAGGVALALLGATYLKLEGNLPLVAAIGAGAFVGGWFAARASRGSTIIEPAIGALLMVATTGALLAATKGGQFLWHVAQDEVLKDAGIVGGVALAGALVGAFISEKALGEATTSALPWILYVALAVLGGCFIAWQIGVVLPYQEVVGGIGRDADTAAKVLLIATAVGALLSGAGAGASARTRVIAAAFLGGGAGVFGAFLLAKQLLGSEWDVAGAAVIAGGGAIVATLGAAIGWGLIGRRGAA